MMQMEVDDLTYRFLLLLTERIAEEPLRPTDEMPEGMSLEVAERHHEWFRQVAGLRALIGVRLTNTALEQVQRRQK